MKLYIYTTLFLFSTIRVALGQNFKEIEKKLIQNNCNLDFYDDSICKITQIQKLSAVSKTDTNVALLDFRNYKQFKYFDLYSKNTNYFYRYFPDTILVKWKDSVPLKFWDNGKSDLNKGIYCSNSRVMLGSFWMLESFFKIKNYKSTSLSSKDGINTLIQTNMKDSIVRIINYDNNYKIISMRRQYLTFDDIIESDGLSLKQISPNRLQEIVSSPEYDFPPKKEEKKLDSCYGIFVDSNVIAPNFKGKYLLVDYWYISCPPCHQIRPSLERLYAESDTSKVQFIGINSYDTEDKIKYAVAKRNMKIPEVKIKCYNPYPTEIHAHPTIILFNKDLSIKQKWEGYSEEVVKEIENTLLYLE